MPNPFELRGYLNPCSTLTEQVGWKGPKRHTPIPHTREEMAAQLDKVWSELRSTMLDHAFPQKPPYTAGDEPEARDD